MYDKLSPITFKGINIHLRGRDIRWVRHLKGETR